MHKDQWRANLTPYESMRALELLHEILTRLPSSSTGWVHCTRTELCKKLCHHPRRPGSITTGDLDRLLPRLIEAGVACEVPRCGKPPALIVRPITSGELLARTQVVREARDKYFAEHPDPADRAMLSEWIAREERVLRTIGPQGRSPELLNPIEKLYV